ncbi:FMN-dependent NADH-azoreductase [Serratia sp. 22264]|uniref:FMN-dependent NADH-azoreductase n=1 Tax=Serratia sp. 22264 TaxID=3453897 RepID=UPI003F835C8E
MKLLHLDSSILGHNSVSRQLSADIVSKVKIKNPAISVSYHDLVGNPIPHLSGAYLAAAQDLTGENDTTLHVLDEFLAADIVVIGTALYNLGISSQLKAWVDRITVNGKTFRYTDKGLQGLAGSKKVVLAVARGGYYGPESPAAAMEHAEAYMRAIFSFIGVTDIQVVIAEGLNLGPEKREQALTSAARQINELNV